MVDRPRQAVFSFLSEPSNIVRLPGSGDIAEWTSDPPYGVGSTFRFDARIMGLTVSSRAEVTAWSPPFLYARKARNKLLTAEFTFELEEDGGGTKLTSRGNLDFASIPDGVARIFGGLIERRLRHDLRSIKALLENSEV